MDDPFDDFIMLHGWPESGNGRLQVEDLYQMFKARMELEKHEPTCWLRAAIPGDECSCKLSEHPSGDEAHNV